ncbi:hypothetical protein AALF15_13680 [Corynebacteriaceae bacterium 7-707]
MTWLLIFAGLVVLLVGGAVLPRRAEYRGDAVTTGFPWFWLVFPLTALLVALAAAAWLPGSPASGFVDFGWGMSARYVAEGDSRGWNLLSDEAAKHLLAAPGTRIVYPLLAALGALLSARAWKKRLV